MRLSAWWSARRSRRSVRFAPVSVPGQTIEVDPVDVADLDARLAEIAADGSHAHDVRLASLLRPLVERRTPARSVEAVPGLGTARVRFADGTALLIEGEAPGDVAILARWIWRGSVVPTSSSSEADGTHLVFWSSSRRRLSVRVTGLDQPD